MIDYKYAYLIGAIITLVIWIIIFYKRKDLRKEMLTLSFITMFLAPTNILYFGDYWTPQFVFDIHNFGIESIIVCFAYGGICGVIYEYLFRKTPAPKRGVNTQLSNIQVLISFLFGIIAIFALEVFTELNVIYTTTTGLLVMGLLLIYLRHDLFFPGVISAIASTVIAVLVYWLLILIFPDFFDLFWIRDTITNVRFLLIPIEEYYFHFALGLTLGIIYEVRFGLYDKLMNK